MYAHSPEIRDMCNATSDALLDLALDHADGAGKRVEEYYSKVIGFDRTMQQFKTLMNGAHLDDSSLFLLLLEFRTIAAGRAPVEVYKDTLSKSISLLERCVSRKGKLEFERFLDVFRLPNVVLE